MKIGEALGTAMTYEVWRRHMRSGDDHLVAAQMNARESLRYLRECERYAEDLPQLSFYRVRVTSVRERVEET